MSPPTGAKVDPRSKGAGVNNEGIRGHYRSPSIEMFETVSIIIQEQDEIKQCILYLTDGHDPRTYVISKTTLTLVRGQFNPRPTGGILHPRPNRIKILITNNKY